MTTETKTFNDKSSFTANGVAYRRTFTQLPYAKEIWQEFCTLHGQPSEAELAELKHASMIPFFEARYVATDQKLAEGEYRQIFEIASGLSGRGMDATSHPYCIYVEMDLPEKIAEKRQIVGRIADKLSLTLPNLHLLEGNAASADDIEKAAEHFELNQPVAVICEGLLRYMSFPDKEILGRSIHKLLKEHGGVWITPDIEFLSDTARPDLQKNYQGMMARAGFDVRPNLFRDKAHAQEFFQKLGFTIEEHSLSTMVDVLFCRLEVNLSEETVAKSLENRWLYVMKPA